MFVIYSVLILCQIQEIQSLFLSVGDYSNESIPGLNTPECGLSSVPFVNELSFNNKCYQNKYQNKTVVYFDRSIEREKSGEGTEQPESRIQNGTEILDITEAPWVVYLRPRNWFNHNRGVCTGVLITFEWVLTAAHCYEDWDVEWLPDFVGFSTLSITVGSPRAFWHRSKGKLLKQKFKFISHPLYKEPRLPYSNEPLNQSEVSKVQRLNDIALIKVPNLRKEISKYDQRYFVNTICLPKRDEVNHKEEQAQFYGYGIWSDNFFSNQFPDYLQTGWITLYRFEYCAAGYHRYCHKTGCGMMCGHAAMNSAKPCSGDSGGPLVQFKGKEKRAILAATLRGVSRTTPRCVSAKYAFWIPTSHHIDWILETMKKYG